MQLDKSTVKKILGIITFTIALIWLAMNYTIALDLIALVWGLVSPFLMGLAMAFLLNLPMKWLENRLPKRIKGQPRRIISFVLTLVLVVLFIVLFFALVIPQLVATVQLMATNMPGYLARLQASLEPYASYVPQLQEYISSLNLDWQSIAATMVEYLRSGAGNILTSAVGVTGNIIGGLVSFFIGLIFACYVLLDKEHLAAQLRGLLHAYLPEKPYQKLYEIAAIANRIFSKFVAGQCTEGLVIGTIFGVVLWVSGFNYALLIGVCIGVLSLIPVFGTTIACIIGAVLILVAQGFWRAVAFVILFLVIQQIDGNFIYPHIVGTSVGLPPIWVLVAVTLGGSLGGLGGMFICIPVASLIYVLLAKNARSRLQSKGIPLPSEGELLHADKRNAKAHKPKRKWPAFLTGKQGGDTANANTAGTGSSAEATNTQAEAVTATVQGAASTGGTPQSGTGSGDTAKAKGGGKPGPKRKK